MYEIVAAWRPVDANIKNDVSVRNPLALSRLVLVRLGAQQAPARWRHALERYDSSKRSIIKREGAWWSQQGRTLEFEPAEYRDI